ncbi:MAG: sulfatase [Lentisphaerae bacterium RIFOXYB12_FULL_65_16]|nr:MAG: sulfatase [Lentisphaerae bacterium RIFOXYA12_64_32]OGV91998.1 MAG: sulfatase [Lentisphaerae bacterium RIFOXYB12_FULL_65_16]
MRPPNIIYLHSHDTGRYIQPYGHAVATPNMQRLADSGVLFRQAFCANPTCSPSRACLLTGQSAHSNGMIGLAHRGFSMTDYRHHIIHTLHAAGYTSALAGVQHIAHGPDAPTAIIGYHRFLGPPAVAHEKACEFLANPPSQPFFLSVGFFETHREFPPVGADDPPTNCLPPAPLPDTPEVREDMARYKASARIYDRKVGMILDALERNGLADNTLVINTTDHGIAFPRMKCNLTDSGTGVMLILRGPGGFTGGKVVDGMVSQIDIFPTLCELLGITPPAWLEGTSFLPLVRGEKAEVQDEIFTEVNYHAAYEPMRAVRTRQWKYIRRYDGRTRPVLPNCDDGLSKTVWMNHGWADIAPAEEALFDLVLDPDETHNLAGEPRCASVLANLRARLAKWMQETNDPLLASNRIPAPVGAKVNDPDGISPREEPRLV